MTEILNLTHADDDLWPQDVGLGEIEDPLRLYFNEILHFPRLTPQEEIELAKKVVDGDLEARHKFTNCNLRLAVAVASKYQGRGLELRDLIQAANCGLMIAVDKFDPELGFRFSTYAYLWIRQTVVRTIADQARTRRVPVHNYELLGKMFKVRRGLEQELGREPTNTEVAQRLGIAPEKLEKLVVYISPDFSLETPLNSDMEDTREWGDVIPSPEVSVEEQADLALLKRAVDQALGALPERDRRILRLRFGMDGRPRTLEEVGEEVGVTRERVRQVIAEIFRKWRNHPPEALKNFA